MIDINGVSVICGGRAILEDVSLRVDNGVCCAIIGPNGSGKSTLLAILSGYLWPTVGSVTIAGKVFGKVSLDEVRKMIGLIEPSRMPKFDEEMTVRELVATGLFGSVMLPIDAEINPNQWKCVDAEIESVDLARHVDGMCGTLSTGERMKALIARAMVSQAKLLLLDEPTVGLDIGARAVCMNTLDDLLSRPGSPTVVIVSHHLDELPRNVDQIVLMKDGTVFDSGCAEDMLTTEKLSRLYDCDIFVFRRDGRYAASIGLDKKRGD